MKDDSDFFNSVILVRYVSEEASHVLYDYYSNIIGVIPELPDGNFNQGLAVETIKDLYRHKKIGSVTFFHGRVSTII